MGICYGGKTLREVVDDRTRLFEETGHCYGVERLKLIEEDPAKLMRFQMRLVAACVNARDKAKLITANPVALLMGELLFMIANPEGDCVSASYGLYGHVCSFPYIINSIAELDFEEDPGIRAGDIFTTNDAFYGAPHNMDCYNWIPVFYEDELIAWTVGLNHVMDVGAIQPAHLSMFSPNTFTDGFIYPPTKTGENFKQHRWWELYWHRRTRTGAFNVLDDKMRVAGAVALHNTILDIVEEFGIDYFRQGLKEILERERRTLLHKVKSQAVPGIYHFLYFERVKYEGIVGQLFATSNRNWMIHMPAELRILPAGEMHVDLAGLTSEADFHCNAYPPGVKALASLGCWPMFSYTKTINTSLLYMIDWNIPLGTMFNPQNPLAGTILGIGDASKYGHLFFSCLSNAYFARGFLEECFPSESCGMAYGLGGMFADGFGWAGGDMPLISCTNSNARPYRDGDVASMCFPNPESDLGEVELAEFVQPTNLNIARKLIPNYCGHGKFRGALGIGMTQLIVDPGRSLTVCASIGSGGIGNTALGIAGGYPGMGDVILFAHDTNLRDILDEGSSYPTDFIEVKNLLEHNTFKAGNVEVYTTHSPNIECRNGDVFSFASGAKGGWGEPLDRQVALVEDDARYGWLTTDVARTVYGAVIDDHGNVNLAGTNELRQKMKSIRKERAINAREWWRQEREKVINKEFPDEVHCMYADSLKYEKFRHEFTQMWQLPEDYQL
ncbi:hydantoinase B/oxoprolinase family protein [Chloroflexota bacterium]